MVKHCEVLRRTVHVVNLDPAAEHFDYPLLAGTFQLSHRLFVNAILVFLIELLSHISNTCHPGLQ